MNRQPLQKMGTLLLAVAAVALVAGGCASSPKIPANVLGVQCAAKSIQWEVAPEAEISDFDCQMGTFDGEAALVVTMAVKNISDKPQRYKVQVFLEDMDRAYGHLVPRTGKPPQVAPGAVEKVKLPFVKTGAMSQKILVMVKTMSE